MAWIHLFICVLLWVNIYLVSKLLWLSPQVLVWVAQVHPHIPMSRMTRLENIHPLNVTRCVKLFFKTLTQMHGLRSNESRFHHETLKQLVVLSFLRYECETLSSCGLAHIPWPPAHVDVLWVQSFKPLFCEFQQCFRPCLTTSIFSIL